MLVRVIDQHYNGKLFMRMSSGLHATVGSKYGLVYNNVCNVWRL